MIRSPWRSTTFRFAALVFLLQILTAVALLFAVGVLLRAQGRSEAIAIAETLRDDLMTTYEEGGVPGLQNAIQMRLSRRIERRAVLLLADAKGKIIAGNINAMPRFIPRERYTQAKLLRPGHLAPEAMLVEQTRLPGGAVLVTGTIVESQLQFLILLERASMTALGLSFLFAAFAAFISTQLILHRLGATIGTLGRVREGDLLQRVPRDDAGDAFAHLSDEVNRTLDRLAALNAELKIATDGLAHDLKSPLTRLRSALDRAARQVTEPAAAASVDLALAESERLMAMIETALSITRAEAGMGRESFASIDLSEMLETIAEIYAPLVEDAGRAIVVDAPAGFVMPVHRQLMDQAIGNLVDNAIKYGGGTITLSLEPSVGGGATIGVADEGPGIAPGQRAHALQRFGRLDEARGGSGAGLGLSLVQAVAHLHGGVVKLRDAEPGLEVAITLALVTPAR
ncbi:periplasmic sensor signal transduction histidine kinase [Novosphingobium sp. Rr 2-17]|uniref:HAMP domain-containing sensor histidine kinase n=1 Tax=Novosphingobium sp. Rr 2-17 TaxID=555793 RepID=UPI000269A1A7|nr:HAMP domain-containing sensor histidine kinase [Novosphingobium sp. Rr 2-17]EIZ80314.1 periplasmic sensor signal transduction histidine kinase [Novosphingobium sp. Rr 2-17]